MAELIQLTKTEAVLREYAAQLQERFPEQLRQHGRRATGDLIGSVHTEVLTTAGGRVAVDLHLAEYWKYVEWDTRPHWPPPGSLLKWIEAKPIIPYPDKNGKLPTPKQLDFLIRRKISREGTKGTHDLRDTVQLLNIEYERKIADAVAEDFGDAVDVLIRTFARA